MNAILLVFLFALGACVGSFLNVVIYRMPRGQSIVFPPSHCPSCGRGIRWHDNLPLLSWFLLRGQCRSCKARISPRYVIIEAITAVMVAGLFAWYYVAAARDGAGTIADTWPTFAAHAALLCGLLVCAAVDIESWIVPLEVCWFVSVVGLVAAAAAPPSGALLAPVSANVGATSGGALVGLIVAIVLLRRGIIQPSFLDADERKSPQGEKPNDSRREKPQDRPAAKKKGKKKKTGKKDKKKPVSNRAASKPRPPAVALTRAHGISPRKEILREVLFLAPAIAGAVVAYMLVTRVDAIERFWGDLHGVRHVRGFEAALFGYLIGGLWIWGMRVLGTLAFGKEAMGMGDVHILAAVGAVTGWFLPSVAFFLAPVFGLLWAVYLWASRNQRELPYGPWLAAASFVMLLFYDSIAGFLSPYTQMLRLKVQ